MLASSSVSRRFRRPLSSVVIGELIDSASVNATTSMVTADTLRLKSAAILGSSGAIMKPFVPMENVPSEKNRAG